MKFLRDNWYVAALSAEVTTQPLSRQILGESVALFRSTSGQVTALADACPHRGYPLSRGHVVGDRLVCGYHGFTFDCSGACVTVPGQERVPARANVRHYLTIERGAWVWIWMGHHPTEGSPPETPWLVDVENWSSVSGLATINASFDLLVDNLLDLSHETFLHGQSIGTPEIAETPIEVEVDDDAGVVRVYRHMNAVPCPPFYARTTGLEGPVDRWQDIEYSPPSYYVLHARIAPVGEPPRPDNSDDHAFHMKILYGLTPETETSVHDFWALARDFRLGDDEVSEFLDRMQRAVVKEDVDALNLLEERRTKVSEVSEVSVKVDRGALAARRVLRALNERAPA